MIEVADLSVSAGDFQLDGLSLRVHPGEYGVLMGRTGSGKTTLLECLCGLRPITGGKIVLAGTDVTQLRPAERNIGYVPQDGALFPRMTVQDNLAFPLVVRKWKHNDIGRRVDEIATALSISHLTSRRARALSGGEAQRVAIGRAIIFRPTTLLLDEPLSALDDDVRRQLYDVLKWVQRSSGVTLLHVTHSQEDAARLADRVFRLRDGKVETSDITSSGASSWSDEAMATP